jgi:hypothetical protein
MLPTLRFEPSEQESNSAEPSRVGLLLDAYSGSADLDGIVTAWVLAAPGSSASAGIGSAGATVTLGLRRFGEWEVRNAPWIETRFHVRTGITSLVP